MTDYGTTVGLEGCFILTQRTNWHTLIIPFHILRRCERKQQMDRNNRGRGWRSPVSAFTLLPLLSTSHAQTDRYVNAHIWTHASAHTDTRDTHWIETSDPFDCRHWVLSYKRKTAREIRFFGGDGGGGGGRMKGWARQTEWQEGGDEGGIESVKVWKESHVCISACVKGSKRRNPASDLIWAWMQTTPKAQPLQGAACTESVCVCLCLCMQGWGRLKDWLPGRFWHIGPHSLLPSV